DPCRSDQRLWGRWNSPGALLPGVPQEASNLPSPENRWTRLLRYPSETYRSPEGAITISVGLLKGPAARRTVPPSSLHPVSEGWPLVPRTDRGLPSRVNFTAT